jgi:thiamine phosphate synthase YjbQ (UPF0047 family)
MVRLALNPQLTTMTICIMKSITILPVVLPVLALFPLFTIAFNPTHWPHQHRNLITLSNDASSSSHDVVPLGKPICIYEQIAIQPTGMYAGEPPRQAVSVEDLTPRIKSLLSLSNMRHGVIHVISRHTTTAITINERESRLARDVEQYFLSICPPDERSSSEKKAKGVRYLHNDIDERPDGEEEAQRCRENGWDIDDEGELRRWRDQEPINAHSHLISMMLGSSEAIPVVDGEMVIGQWQSVLMVDLDGPRERTVGIQLMGYE